MGLLSGLLNVEIELQNAIDMIDSDGTPYIDWGVVIKRKATHSNPPSASNNFSENQNRYITYSDVFTIRYDESVNVRMRLKYNGVYYKITTITAIERKKHLILNCVKIENNNYGV